MRNWLVNTHQGLIEPILEGRLGSPYETKLGRLAAISDGLPWLSVVRWTNPFNSTRRLPFRTSSPNFAGGFAWSEVASALCGGTTQRNHTASSATHYLT